MRHSVNHNNLNLRKNGWCFYSVRFIQCMIVIGYLHARSLPRPGHRVQFIWIPYANRLHRKTRIKSTIFECDQRRSVGARALREYDHLWPVFRRWCPIDDTFDGVLSWAGIFTPHIQRLREIDEFYSKQSKRQKRKIRITSQHQKTEYKLRILTAKEGHCCCFRFGQHR